MSRNSDKTRPGSGSGSVPDHSAIDALHDRIQSKLDDLHADIKQLGADVHAANQASSRAHQDRIEGIKQALRDLLKAADRADREWQ